MACWELGVGGGSVVIQSCLGPAKYSLCIRMRPRVSGTAGRRWLRREHSESALGAPERAAGE